MKTRLTLKVRAGARVTQFGDRYGAGWKLQVAAPPVDGKANEAIVRFVAKVAGVPVSAVRIVTGATNHLKILEVARIDPAQLERAILNSHGPSQNSGSSSA